MIPVYDRSRQAPIVTYTHRLERRLGEKRMEALKTVIKSQVKRSENRDDRYGVELVVDVPPSRQMEEPQLSFSWTFFQTRPDGSVVPFNQTTNPFLRPLPPDETAAVSSRDFEDSDPVKTRQVFSKKANEPIPVAIESWKDATSMALLFFRSEARRYLKEWFKNGKTDPAVVVMEAQIRDVLTTIRNQMKPVG